MRVCTRVLLVSEECVVLPICCPKIILVARNTLVLRAINYHVFPYCICGKVGSIRGVLCRDLILYYTSYVAVCSQP